MLLSEIRPFVRYARYLDLSLSSKFGRVLPVDARIFYVESGKAKIEVRNEVFELETSSLCFINSGVPYRHIPCEARYIAFNFDFTYTYSDLTVPIVPMTADSKSFKPLEEIRFSDASFLDDHLILNGWYSAEELLKTVVDEYEKKLSFSEIKISSMFAEFIAELARRTISRRRANGQFCFDTVADYIHANYNRDITNAELGRVFHFHPNYISAEFTKQTGKSLHRYVLELRIMKAIQIMETETISLNEIASRIGFCDGNYFARYFKKITGNTPGKFMKNMNR